ncbi:MAG: pantetheine-phosphate adenylyltransferase [Actinobacteria bacterium]|uniref:Phosphopantetheine adenylyltransferase n=2 Tax=freshwater metagenome TaxID=449393 RepID=A0A6J6AG06_9ZZZZ|nr:pantetheine-phosphate adenylyltransferase [Actinomycetota bacterium]
MSTVLYPGSFDPFHLGHLDVVEQASALFGEVVVAVMHNPDKPSGVLSTDQRVALIAASCAHLPQVSVRSFPGLAVDAALSVKALCIVKGLRTSGDFEVEQQMAHTNFAVSGVRTVYVPCQPRFGFVSSRFIRDIAAHGGNVSSMVPTAVADALTSLFPPRSK